MGTQQCVPFVLLTFFCQYQQYSNYWKGCHGNAAVPYICCCTTCVAANHMKHSRSFNVPFIFLSDLNQIWIFLTESRRSPRYQIPRKSVYCEPRWYIREDRRKDVTQVIGAFRDYANVPEERNSNYNHILVLNFHLEDWTSVCCTTEAIVPTCHISLCFTEVFT